MECVLPRQGLLTVERKDGSGRSSALCGLRRTLSNLIRHIDAKPGTGQGPKGMPGRRKDRLGVPSIALGQISPQHRPGIVLRKSSLVAKQTRVQRLRRVLSTES